MNGRKVKTFICRKCRVKMPNTLKKDMKKCFCGGRLDPYRFDDESLTRRGNRYNIK